jgi:hypothetical protein
VDASDRNDDLWLGQPACPPRASVLRSRTFWVQLYQLDDTWDPSEFSETYTFDFWAGPQAPIPYLGLEVVSRRRESLLVLHAKAKTYEVARLDEAVTMPHLFRWREVEAIADWLVARKEVPSQPSVALLLLAPFLGGTEDERVAITERLPVELDRLGLLTATEIAAAVGNRLVAAPPNARDSDRVRWVSDPSVGWRLEGDYTIIGQTRCPIAHSERFTGSFPCDEFLAFLREAGVRDL